MNVFKKLNKDVKPIYVECFGNYNNCLYLGFTNEKTAKLFDYNTGKYIQTVKVK